MTNYKDTAFVLVKPPSKVVSTHIIKDKKEYLKLIEVAKAKNLLLYFSKVVKRNGKLFATEPLDIDPESIKNYESDHDVVEEQIEEPKTYVSDGKIDNETNFNDEDIKCPYCNKKMTSTPGRTLHVKHKHPDKFEEYKGML